MQGWRVLSLLFTKKKTAPKGEDEGRIMPAARDSERYFSMATRSGLERLYKRLDGKVAPGNRSMEQS